MSKVNISYIFHLKGKMEVPVSNTKYRLQYWNYSSVYAKVLSTHFSELTIFISLYYCKRLKNKIKKDIKLKFDIHRAMHRNMFLY